MVSGRPGHRDPHRRVEGEAVFTGRFVPRLFDLGARTSLFASVQNLTNETYNVAFRPAGARPSRSGML